MEHLQSHLQPHSSASLAFFIVGAYETPDVFSFPSHVAPIVAAYDKALWQRWLYTIHVPYELIPIQPLGRPVTSLSALFPHPTFLSCLPVPLAPHSQAIHVAPGRILVSSNRLYLTLMLVLSAALTPLRYAACHSAFFAVLLNVWRRRPV